jgi:hypothetical protein
VVNDLWLLVGNPNVSIHETNGLYTQREQGLPVVMRHYECRFRCPYGCKETLVCHDWPAPPLEPARVRCMWDGSEHRLPASAFRSVEQCTRPPSTERRGSCPKEIGSQRLWGALWTSLGTELAKLVFLTLIVYGVPLLVIGLLIVVGHWF